MRFFIGKQSVAAALLSFVLILGTRPASAAISTPEPAQFPNPANQVSKTQDMRVQLPTQAETIRVPAPTEELAFRFGHHHHGFYGASAATMAGMAWVTEAWATAAWATAVLVTEAWATAA